MTKVADRQPARLHQVKAAFLSIIAAASIGAASFDTAADSCLNLRARDISEQLTQDMLQINDSEVVDAGGGRSRFIPEVLSGARNE